MSTTNWTSLEHTPHEKLPERRALDGPDRPHTIYGYSNRYQLFYGAKAALRNMLNKTTTSKQERCVLDTQQRMPLLEHLGNQRRA